MNDNNPKPDIWDIAYIGGTMVFLAILMYLLMVLTMI
jgi:hypothetical protein